jgi:hypothetical protein
VRSPQVTGDQGEEEGIGISGQITAGRHVVQGPRVCEGGFDTGKNRLDLDRTYGMTMRAEAGMTAKPSPEGLQRKYASVYSLGSPDPELVYDVGADVKKLDKTLKLNLYQ